MQDDFHSVHEFVKWLNEPEESGKAEKPKGGKHGQ